MKTRALRTALCVLTSLTLLAAFSTSTAQAPISPAPSADSRWSTGSPALPAKAQPPAQAFSQPGSPNDKPNAQVGGPRIRLAVGEFDPLVAPEPAGMPSTLRLSGYAGDGTGYYLVQFRGPVATSDVDALTAAGAAVFDYIPDFAFIVKMDNATRTAVGRLKQVRWVGLYQPAYRLPADLLAKASDGMPLSHLSRPGGGPQIADPKDLWDDSPIELIVSVFRGESSAPVISQIEDMGGAILDQSWTAQRNKLKVSIPPSRLTGLAAIGGVRWIEEAPEWRLANNEAADIMGVRAVWDTHGLYGDGQTVAVCDSGLDRGSRLPAFLHDDFENGSGATRVAEIQDWVGDGADDVNSGHGTHVAGSVLGNGDRSGADPGTHSYPDTAYVGVAPEAGLVFQAVENNLSGGLTGIPLDLNVLFGQAADSGAALHTNSWGSAAAGRYTTDSEDVDEYVWLHKDFTILFSAGNEGIDSDVDGVVDLGSVGSPGTAKNCITVGASESDRSSGGYNPGGACSAWGTCWPSDFPADPVRSDRLSNDPAGMAAFSSRGPTRDWRLKPDVVAPGTNIASVRSSLATGSGWGAIDGDYMYMGGTSMATPLVAGAAAIVRQYYTDVEGITPSAALIKATLVNGAIDVNPGQYGTGAGREIPGPRPTNVAGWGRVNLENSIFPSPPRTVIYDDEPAGLHAGESETYTYTVTNTAEPFRVTLAWSDYPGSPATDGALVNDLDLEITGPGGTTYYPDSAGQRGASDRLACDDGISTGALYWSAGNRVAVRFTPATYPATLQTGLFYVGSRSETYPKSFNWYVYGGSDATGPTGSPLASGSTVIRTSGWHAVDMSGAGITISSGDLFLALELPDDDLVWFFDRSTPVDRRSWDDSSGSWSKYTAADYMFNAIVRAPHTAINQDRVNNLVGIDIESPIGGVYTVTVSGHNVPYGPQPYALVVSTSLPEPDVGVLKRVIGSDFEPGDPITFTLTVANRGSDVAAHTVVTDVVPGEVLTPTFASTLAVTPTGVVSYVWQVEPLGIGEGGVITIYGLIDPSLERVPVFSNTATISDPGDHTPGNGTSSVAVGERKAYLPIAMRNWSSFTSTTLYASPDDTTLESGNPDTWYGDYITMWVGYSSDPTLDKGIARSIMHFDLSSIPPGTSIRSATLQPYFIWDHPSGASGDMQVTAYRVNAPWPVTPTWSTFANAYAEAYGSQTIGTGFGRLNLDVTALVQGWVNGTWPNQGVMLRGQESGDDNLKGFGSANGSSTYRPQLVVEYYN